MAKINLQLETNLDVIDKYTELMNSSLDSDSIYVRAKETLKELFDDSAFDNRERGEIVSQVISSIAGSITANSMGTALQWASQEKTLFLNKAEAEYRLSLLNNQDDRAAIETEIASVQKNSAQADSLRQHGETVVDQNGDVVSLSDEGILFNQNEGLKRDVINKGLQADQIQSGTNQAYAATHRIIADTYVNHGVFSGYTLASSGLTGVVKEATNYVTLSDLNKVVAKEQARGYTLNAWTGANTSSASMIGTLLAAEIPGLDTTPYLSSWVATNTKLTELVIPTISI